MYQEKAVNSAFITSKNTTSQRDRMFLFELIGSSLIRKELNDIFINCEACFLNTQLFFDPSNIQQKNYWHRDIQYTGKSLNEQKKAIVENVNNVVHFRIAIRDEDGIELIPGTNKRWDNNYEYEVRNNLNGRNLFDDLPKSEAIPLSRGDLLIFSANMIHRGLYGKGRFALDILYCEADPDIVHYIDINCYPEKVEFNKLENSSVFIKFYEVIAGQAKS